MIPISTIDSKYGYAMRWDPSGEPEPSRIPDYTTAADEAEQNSAGAMGACDSIGR